MNEIFKLIGKIIIDTDEAEQGIDDVTDHAESGSNTMANSFKKVGSFVATYLAVDKIVSFGKSCVEAAAQVKAQTAQFEAAFGDMQGEAKKMFDSISGDTGVLATRLQTVGTGAFSQFKGAGLDAAEALKKTGEYTNLAADAAAYYDMSLEEADSLMRSFIRGNTEAGDRIGLFTSETQRNDAALAKLGKKYIECTEAEKQMIMLDIASSIYESSGAMGQASREADGYENVMGNLKESWRQFMAIVGQPLLEAVIPVIQRLSGALTTAGEKVKLFYAYFQDNIGKLKPIWDTYGKPVFDAFMSIVDTIYQGWLIIFPSLKVLWQSFMSLLRTFWNSIGKPIFDAVMWAVKRVAAVFKEVFPIVAQIVSSVFKLIANYWNTTLKPVIELIGAILKTVLLPAFKFAFNTALSIIKTVFKGIKVVWDSVLYPIFNKIITVSGNIASTVRDKFTSIYNSIKDKFTAAKNLIKSIIDAIKGFFNFKISWPNIPTPHFRISPKGWKIGDLLKGSIPKLGIDWYEKAMNNPMIMNGPTIFGYNPATGQLMGGGEKGSEVVSGTKTLLDLIAYAVASQNGGIVEVLGRILAILDHYLPTLARLQVVLDTGELVGGIAPAMDEELGKIQEWKGK